MAKYEIEIEDDVRVVLNRGHTVGHLYYLPNEQLDRKLYERVNKVLTIAGGKWIGGKTKAHMFENNHPDEVLGLALESGSITDKKQLHQQFFTPDELACRLMDKHINYTCLGAYTRCMDPSAGHGSLMRALKRHHTNVLGFDIDQNCIKKMQETGLDVLKQDFLQVEPTPGMMMDLIYMNPPFTGGQDIDHVLHAFRFLNPGCSLYAIMSPGWMYQTGKKNDRWRGIFGAFGKMLEQLSEGAFKESGTNVRTVFIKLTHPDW